MISFIHVFNFSKKYLRNVFAQTKWSVTICMSDITNKLNLIKKLCALKKMVLRWALFSPDFLLSVDSLQNLLFQEKS